MSTAENARGPNNALPSEKCSDTSLDGQASSNTATEKLTDSAMIANEPSTHSVRPDSTLPQVLPRPVNSTDQNTEDADRTAETSQRMQSLSLAADLRNSMQTAPQKHLPPIPPPPPEKDVGYLDPTPKTPQISRPVSRQHSDDGEYNDDFTAIQDTDHLISRRTISFYL